MKYALKLIFPKCIFEFMINTAPPALNSVYGREKLFWYEKIIFSNHAVFCFFVPFFFFVFSFFFPFSLFFFVVYRWPYWSCALDQYINIYFKFKSGVLFCKRDFKSFWSAYWPYLRPEKKKNISCQDMSLLWNSWFFFFFFSVSWHHDKQHTVHHRLY